MSVWPGWAELFLNTAIKGAAPGNVKFLHDWAAHSRSPQCGNNPIDLTRRVNGSTDCLAWPSPSKRAYQAYRSHDDAATAFSDQLLTGPYPDLEAALLSGNPYTFGDITAVANQLIDWGAVNFVPFYLNATKTPPPALKASQTLEGWADFRRSINRHMPAALHSSQRSRKAALRILSHASKVRL